MKKLSILLLMVLFVFAAFIFSGCDNNNGPDDKPGDSVNDEESNDKTNDENNGEDNGEDNEKDECVHVSKALEFIPPTCEKEGYTEGAYCSACNKILVEQQVIPKLDHELAIMAGKSPNCEENGYDDYEYCVNCDYSTITIIPASHAIYTVEEKLPTCYEDGYKEYNACSICDYTTKIIIPAGHSIVKEKAKDATCYEDGHNSYEWCTVCSYSTYSPIPASHSLEYVEAKDATCYEDGHNSYEWCTVCSYSTYSPIPAAHNLEYAEAKDATCYEDGHNSYEWCTVCGYSTKTVVPKAHNLVSVDAKESTCYEDGYNAHEYCIVCDYTTKVVYVGGHILVGVGSKDATCYEDGYNEYEYCARCEYTTIEYIPSGHVIESVDAKEPTCDDFGNYAYEYCVRCEYTTYTAIDPYGHNYLYVNGVKPTCMSVGYESYCYCDRCNFSTRVDIPAVDHKYADVWSIDVEATEDNVGIKSRHCIYDEKVGCGMRVDVTEYTYEYYTPGLEFTLLSDGTYGVSFPNASGEDVIIPKTYLGLPVSSVLNFDGFVTTVYFPEGIKYINGGAFYSCPITTRKIVFPDTLEYIGDFAFCGEYTVDFGNSTPMMERIPFSGALVLEAYTTSVKNWLIIAGNSLNSILPAGAHVYVNGELLEGEVVIPDGFTEIPRQSFFGQFHVTSVVIPSSVTVIDVSSFEYSGVKEIYYQGTIDEWCHMRVYSDISCATLYTNGEKVEGKVVIPETVTVIGPYLFAGQDITEVVLHNGITEIQDYAFCSTGITKLQLPDSLEIIGNKAFYSTLIKELVIPEGTVSIGWAAFSGLDLELLVLPSTLAEMEESFRHTSVKTVYYNCEDLVFISNGFSQIENANTIYIGSTVKYIPEYLFSGDHFDGRTYCELYFDEDSSLVSIGRYAFRGLSLRYVIIPESVEYVHPDAFAGCGYILYGIVDDGLDVVFPDSPNAVIGCDILETAGYTYLISNNEYYMIGSRNELRGEVVLPSYAVYGKGYYLLDIPYSPEITSLIIPESVVVITDIFYNRFENLKTVILHGTLGCGTAFGGVETLELYGKIEVMPYLSYHETLKSVILGDGFTELYYGYFEHCLKLESVKLPDSLTSIEYDCFKNCISLKYVLIPASVNYLNNAFSEWTYVGLAHTSTDEEYLSGYHRINVKEFIIEGDDCLYVDNDGVLHELGKVNLPDKPIYDTSSSGGGGNEKHIGEFIFNEVHSYDIEGGVYIYRAYLGDTSSGIIVLPETIDGHRYVIGSNAFSGEEWLVSITIRGVDSIDCYAFENCINLREVYLEEGLISIGDFAFSGTAIESITIPKTVDTIYWGAFVECESLDSVIILDTDGWDNMKGWHKCPFCMAKIMRENGDYVYFYGVWKKYTN